jgi:predicted esterase
VLIAPSAHYGDKGRTLVMFAAERDARHMPLIVVSPMVINADRVAAMTEYRGAVADAIAKADAADGFRDEVARAKFDSEGILAILRDVQQLHHGDARVYITGFSSSTHIAYMFLFTHPELLRGVVINSGVYLERGVDTDRLPFLNQPKRARLPVKFIIGETDPGYSHCLENWEETRAELLRCGHSAARLQSEVVRAGNAAHLATGHTWYPTRILDFCAAVERGTDF